MPLILRRFCQLRRCRLPYLFSYFSRYIMLQFTFRFCCFRRHGSCLTRSFQALPVVDIANDMLRQAAARCAYRAYARKGAARGTARMRAPQNATGFVAPRGARVCLRRADAMAGFFAPLHAL